jgi:hypothetical protein
MSFVDAQHEDGAGTLPEPVVDRDVDSRLHGAFHSGRNGAVQSSRFKV